MQTATDRKFQPTKSSRVQGGMADVARLSEGRVHCASCGKQLSMQDHFQDDKQGLFFCEKCSDTHALEQ